MGRGTGQVPKQIHFGCPPEIYEGFFLLPLFWNKLPPGQCHLNLDQRRPSLGVQGSMSLSKLLASTTVPLDEMVAAALYGGEPNAEAVLGERCGNKIKIAKEN